MSDKLSTITLALAKAFADSGACSPEVAGVLAQLAIDTLAGMGARESQIERLIAGDFTCDGYCGGYD